MKKLIRTKKEKLRLFSPIAIAIYLFVLGLSLELYSFLLLSKLITVSTSPTYLSLFLHILAAMILTSSFEPLVKRCLPNRDFSNPMRMFAICIFMGCPFIGPAIVLSTTLCLFLFNKKEDFTHHYLMESEVLPQDDEDMMSRMAGQETIVEILNSSQAEARRTATLGLRSFEPKFSLPILKKGVQDSDEEVRMYAMRILEKHLDHFENKIRELNKKIEADHPAKVKLLVDLADEYHEQVYVGIATDDSTKKLLLDKALNALDRALKLEPENLHILLKLLKTSLQAHELDKAFDAITTLYDLGYPQHPLLTWECEIAYHMKDWESLFEILGHLPEKSAGIDGKLRKLQDFWLKKKVA